MKMILYEHQTVSVLTAAAHYPEYPRCVSATGGCRLLSPFIPLRCRQSPLGEPANPSPAHTRPPKTKTRAKLSIVTLRVSWQKSYLYLLNKKDAMNAMKIQGNHSIFLSSHKKIFSTKCSKIKMMTASPKPIVKTIKLSVHL